MGTNGNEQWHSKEWWKKLDRKNVMAKGKSHQLQTPPTKAKAKWRKNNDARFDYLLFMRIVKLCFVHNCGERDVHWKCAVNDIWLIVMYAYRH